jgi:hypothetical protein
MEDKTLCWACKTPLDNEGQLICLTCDRWQKAPLKYINISNASLAIIAALVSTGVAVFSVYSNYLEKSHFHLFMHGRSIAMNTGNINMRIQNYSRNSAILDSSGICKLRTGPAKQFTFVVADRFRLFPPIMSTHTTDRFFTTPDPVERQLNEVYECEIGLENEFGYTSVKGFTATVK